MRSYILALGGLLVILTGCNSPKPIWREMLGKSISEFTYPVRDNNMDRVWIKNMADSDCHRGCQANAGCCGVLGALPGIGGGLGGGASFDGLAYEVFSNYITQKKKGRVVESHRHNYATDFAPETRTKIEMISDGKALGTTMSCEDLCLLDEAKKRRADKVLVYQILEMKADEMLIHLRYSDVRTGVVEMARTLKVEGLAISDRSF